MTDARNARIAHDPPTLLAAPSYTNGIETRPGGRTLYIAGQLGWDKNGTPAEGFAAQADLAFANLRAVLQSAGMDYSDLVKTTIYLTRREDYAELGRIRSAHFAGAKPASTLVFVSALIRPELLVEIDAIAVAG